MNTRRHTRKLVAAVAAAAAVQQTELLFLSKKLELTTLTTTTTTTTTTKRFKRDWLVKLSILFTVCSCACVFVYYVKIIISAPIPPSVVGSNN